jgi:GNAT superfamily N-acetyltransferase
MTSTSLVVRALAEHEARELFTSLHDPASALLGPPLTGRPYATAATGGVYRPEWTWVALRGGVVVARAAFFGAPGDTEPVVLDWFDFTDRAAAVELLRRLPWRVGYELMLPPDWRRHSGVRAAAEARIEAAEAAGYTLLGERLRYTWTPECGLPERPGRLEFRPVPDGGEGEEAVLDVLRRVHSVTLDAHARLAIAGGGVEQAVREELEYFRWCSSPRSWWRLAYTPDGAPVGLHVPVLIPAGPCVGFVGVVPGQRGHGYAYDLLAECTHQLAAEGAESIVAATDVTNTPMAAHFARAGYPVEQHRVCLR